MRKLSEETKKKLSEARKKYLKENPEKHVWKRHDKFKSEPCENVKKYLTEIGILFIPEYTPPEINRSYSIDIAFPDKKIALEINGSQHYERNGELKPYYVERQGVLEAAGWDVYNIHYSCCFKIEKWAEFLNKLKESNVKVDFDYFNYTPRKKQEYFCSCGLKKSGKKTINCQSCRLKIDAERKRINLLHNSYEKDKCLCGGIKCKKSFLCKNCQLSGVKIEDKPYRKPRIQKCTRLKDLCQCGSKKLAKCQLCRKCNNKRDKKTKINWPDKDALERLVWEKPSSSLAKDLGVSDKAIDKRCEKYGIKKPPRGYWMKKKYGKL